MLCSILLQDERFGKGSAELPEMLKATLGVAKLLSSAHFLTLRLIV